MLLHAPWGGRELIEGAAVLDAFAGTGALGLEALSRGAASARFIERDRAALGALRDNIAACRAGDLCTVLPADVLTARHGAACGLVFFDPPYGQDLVPKALERLGANGWIAPGAIVVEIICSMDRRGPQTGFAAGVAFTYIASSRGQDLSAHRRA